MNQVPPVADWFQNGFHRFLRTYLRKHFHTIAISKAGWQPESLTVAEPLIVYGNHPAWWDPLIAHFVNRHCFAPRQFYAPIDATALRKYRVFSKLGFYGIDLSTYSGAAEFLKQSQAILAAPRTAVWLTPEGRFVDCRDHTAELMPGLSHLCSKMKTGKVVAMALEYVFMQERKPECLLRFSEPIGVATETWSKTQWHEHLTQSLRRTQAELAAEIQQRDLNCFRPLTSGKAGVGGLYDMARRLRSLARGERFQAEHDTP